MADYAFQRNETFGYAQEAAYNEAWGTPTLLGMHFLNVDFKPNIEIIKSAHMTGRPESVVLDHCQGVRNYAFTIKMRMPKECLAGLMLSALGKVTTTGASSPYTHTFVPSITAGYPCSLKLQYRQPLNAAESCWQLSGAKVKSMLFEFNAASGCLLTVEFVGGTWAKAAALGTAPTILMPAGTENPFWSFSNVASMFPQFGTIEGGFCSCQLKIENIFAEDLEDSYELGSHERIRLERSGDNCIKITGTLKRLLKDNTVHGYWDTFYDAGFSIRSTSGAIYMLQIKTAGDLILNQPTRIPRAAKGLIEETIDFESLYDLDVAAGIEITIKDSQATPATQGS